MTSQVPSGTAAREPLGQHRVETVFGEPVVDDAAELAAGADAVRPGSRGAANLVHDAHPLGSDRRFVAGHPGDGDARGLGHLFGGLAGAQPRLDLAGRERTLRTVFRGGGTWPQHGSQSVVGGKVEGRLWRSVSALRASGFGQQDLLAVIRNADGTQLAHCGLLNGLRETHNLAMRRDRESA